MYKLVIFDFDGTLADTNAGIVRTFQATFREMGITPPDEETISSTIGLTLFDGFKAAMPELTDEQADTAVAVYRRLFPSIAFPIIEAFPGTIEALAEIKARGIRMAVATSRSHHSLEKLAGQIGAIPYLEGLYGAEDVVNHKPAPDLVNLILKTYGLTPEDALVVGDATFDLLMGQGAGCKVCGVTWGNQTREKLSSVHPDFLADSFSELLELI